MSQLVQIESRRDPSLYPAAPIAALDTLWFQVAGTVCNLECTHCFISCSPTNHTHEMLKLEQVLTYLEEAKSLGVREYYFTGGEPFMNKDLLTMLEATLKQGPASVLTNGVMIRPETARALRELWDNTEYSLDLRISIDGYTAEANDPIRGKGTFARILGGIENLAAVGLNPVITVTEACEDAQTRRGRTEFLDFLRSVGLSKPRLKILPLIRLGAETERERGYHAYETLEGTHLSADELAQLQCTNSRMVCEQGVYVCPILINDPSAKMGQTLTDTLKPFPLSHQACYTCHEEGLRCAT